MKAAMWYGRKDVRVLDVKEPVIGPGKVKIRVACCGICGTDLHEYAAGPIFIPVDTPHPLTGVLAPVMLGHEFSGEVIEIGADVNRVKVGNRVCVEPIISCGSCAACSQGKYNLCTTIAFHGISSSDGGAFAEITMASQSMVHKIPDTMSYEQGAMVEPAAMALHAVQRSDFRAGNRVAVFGAGPIGLLMIQVIRAAGATDIISIETSPARRAHALKVGATAAIDPLEGDCVQAIREITSGGVDISFEASGAPAALFDAIGCTVFDGQIVVVSVWEGKAELNPNDFVFQERNMIGILGNRNTFPSTIQMISSGTLDVEELITKNISLNDIVAEGFEALLKSKNQVKILVRPEMGS